MLKLKNARSMNGLFYFLQHFLLVSNYQTRNQYHNSYLYTPKAKELIFKEVLVLKITPQIPNLMDHPLIRVQF